MALHPSNNVQHLGAAGIRDGYTTSGGTGRIPTRDWMDEIRVGQGRTPASEWPDGYLGQLRDRRDDRILGEVRKRENTRPYNRGVHKGERIGVESYFWPTIWGPQYGVYNQMRGGTKQTPMEIMAERPIIVNDGKTDTEADKGTEVIDPFFAEKMLKRLSPPWN